MKDLNEKATQNPSLNIFARQFANIKIEDCGLIRETKQKIDAFENDRVKIYMYKEDNHKLPHFHIYINMKKASYTTKGLKKLAGDCFSKQDRKKLKYWHSVNDDVLLKIWNKMQKGDAKFGVNCLLSDW